MKTTGIILLALMLGTVSCKSEKKETPATAKAQVAMQTASNEADNDADILNSESIDEVELPVYGNFQLDSKGTVLTLIGFYPENGIEIFDFSYDEEEAMPKEDLIYRGTYHVTGKPKGNIYTVDFTLTSADGKTKKTGRIRMEYLEPDDKEVFLHTYRITPLKGYDLGLPAGKASDIPFSAWQAWD